MKKNNGRKPNGQFAEGNRGGPGRPPRDVETDYLAALSAVVTVDRWRRIVERAATDAESGDYRAREWLGRYLVGDKPVVAISMTSEEPIDASAVRRELLNYPDYVEWQRQQALTEDQKLNG